MAGFRRIVTASLLMLQVLSCTAVTYSYFTVRAGDEVALHCGNVTPDQDECDRTTWLFSDSVKTETLFKEGKIHKDAEDKSDRLSVSEKCSLVIKNVTDEDVGQYTCRQFRPGQYQDAQVFLSVVTLTEHKDTEEVTVICSVSSAYEGCRQTVKWLLEGQDVDKGNKDVMTSQSSCSSNVTFKTSHVVYTSKNSELLKCKVTKDHTNEVNLFPFSPPQSSDWWPYAVVAVGLAALLVLVAAVGRWITTRASKTQVDDSTALTSNPAATQPPPEGRQDPVTSHSAGADPEEGVSYASVSYTNKTDGAAQVRGGEDAVTYSSVRLPSTDSSNLYATVNTPPV